MRKLAIICFSLFFICCRSSKIKPEASIIEAFVNQVLLNKPNSITKPYYEHGIRIKEIEDGKWFEYYHSRKLLNTKNFNPTLSDSLFNILFNKKAIEFYNKQLLNESLDSTKINRLISKIKIRTYSEEVNEKYKDYKLPIINISKPLLSLDKNFALIYYTDSHAAHIYVLKKNQNEWKYFSMYNSMFPNGYNNSR